MADTRPPRTGADEASTLLGFLDYLRDAITDKVTGVPEPQIRTAGVPSGTSLLGLVKHLTAVERFWFLGEDSDDWAATMRPTPDESTEQLLADYRKAVEQANEVVGACTDLSRPVRHLPRPGSGPSMRWILTHLIEETGRHAGHADILREQIDGTTGR
ncbi:DinB family protein [Streptomyces sp. NBC_01508]|uniref:DinB family protein n=1 Tax=Streptomyces sp. NBC_01508 TaxID=2903888 RepID=UPI0038691804